MKQWWKKIEKQRMTTDEYIHTFISKMFDENDAQRLRLKWENQLCSTESVCIFMSCIFHDNKRSFNKKWIVILIYHIIVLKDKVNLKIKECEMKNEIAAALQDQWFLRAMSFDLKNNVHKRLFFRHFATVEIQEICFTFNVIMRLWSWDTLKVLKKRKLLFNQNLNQIQKMIEFCHNFSIFQMKRAYERLRKTKIAIYKSKSYFYCTKNEIFSMKNDE
jgi:hypothetical protein